MKKDEIYASILGCSVSGYYKWKKQNRLVFSLFEKYFSNSDLEEFVNTGSISKLETMERLPEILKNEKKKALSVKSEFYLHKSEILKLYKEGYSFAKEIYNLLNLNMSYWSFNYYYNKEIKNIQSPAPKDESKENLINDNNYQNKKEDKNDNVTPTLARREAELKKRLEEDLANSKYFEIEAIGRRLREDREKNENEKKDENEKNNSSSKQ